MVSVIAFCIFLCRLGKIKWHHKTSYSKINFPMVRCNILAAAWHQTKDFMDSDITNLLVIWALTLYQRIQCFVSHALPT